MNRRPKGDACLAERLMTLQADVLAAMCLHSLTGGQTFHQVYQSLGVELEGGAGRIALRSTEVAPQVWMDLIYALSASWRYSSGWDAEHTNSLDCARADRSSASYVHLAMSASEEELFAARGVVLTILGELIVRPAWAALAKRGEARSDSASPSQPTGITPTS